VATTAAVGSAQITKLVATFAAGGATALILSFLIAPPGESSLCKSKIQTVFPGALKNKELVRSVSDNLKKFGYGRNSLVATSLCSDEVNRVLEKDFAAVYDDNFSMGGLAGFPFGGVTSFGAMAAHIPDGGSCLVVFGPHVGVDATGTVGTVERRGRANGGPCCGSAVAASGYVAGVSAGKDEKVPPPTVATDAQQNFVGNMLLVRAGTAVENEKHWIQIATFRRSWSPKAPFDNAYYHSRSMLPFPALPAVRHAVGEGQRQDGGAPVRAV